MPIFSSLVIQLEDSVLYRVICINQMMPYYEAEYCSQ